MQIHSSVLQEKWENVKRIPLPLQNQRADGNPWLCLTSFVLAICRNWSWDPGDTQKSLQKIKYHISTYISKQRMANNNRAEWKWEVLGTGCSIRKEEKEGPGRVTFGAITWAHTFCRAKEAGSGDGVGDGDAYFQKAAALCKSCLCKFPGHTIASCVFGIFYELLNYWQSKQI